MRRIKKSPLFPYIVTLFAYFLMLLWGFGPIQGDEMGYALVCFYIAAPAVSALCGFFLGRAKTPLKWAYPLTGTLNWAVGFIVFEWGAQWDIFSLYTALAGVPALFGVLAGIISRGRGKEADKRSAIDKMSARDLE